MGFVFALGDFADDIRGMFLRFAAMAMSVTGALATAIALLGDWHWYADLFSHLRPQYCVWLAIAAVIAFCVKHRTALIVASLALTANAVALAPYAMPWRDAHGAGVVGRTWTFASVNLLYGNRDVSRVTGYVRRVGADVVVFQEVSARWAQDLEALSDLYPYRSTQSRKNSFGCAVFSKEKPVSVTMLETNERNGELAAFADWEDGGRRIGVVAVHPDKPDDLWKVRNRETYLAQVAQWCDKRARANQPVVVIGDFNATPWSASMKAFTRKTGLRNTNQGTIFGASWNVWQPHRLLIDHALLSSHWKLLRCEIGPAIGSDHRPLLIQVAL